MKAFALLALFFLCAGPASAKPRDERPYPAMRREGRAREVIVTNHVHIPTCWKFNPVFWFGNYDRPLPPRSYKPGDPHRVLKWRFRNPCHNFDFYVIGIADKTFRRVGKYPDKVFAPNGGFNWAVCKYKLLRLPFVSWERGRFKFYCGWRNRGQFGFELKLSASPPAPPDAPRQSTPRNMP